MASPKCVLFYLDDIEAMETLSYEERGRLFTALLQYAAGNGPAELTGNERHLFPIFKARVDRDMKKYEKVCERNARNIQKRWDKADTTGKSGIPSDTKNTTGISGIPKIPNQSQNQKENQNGSKSQEQDIKVAAATHPQYDYEYFQQTYNGTCSKLPTCQVMSEKRREAIRKFSKDFTPAQWADICSKANRSGFLTGKNDRGWRADIDFLLRPDKAARIIEGGYVEGETPAREKTLTNDAMDKYLNF